MPAPRWMRSVSHITPLGKHEDHAHAPCTLRSRCCLCRNNNAVRLHRRRRYHQPAARGSLRGRHVHRARYLRGGERCGHLRVRHRLPRSRPGLCLRVAGCGLALACDTGGVANAGAAAAAPGTAAAATARAFATRATRAPPVPTATSATFPSGSDCVLGGDALNPWDEQSGPITQLPYQDLFRSDPVAGGRVETGSSPGQTLEWRAGEGWNGENALYMALPTSGEDNNGIAAQRLPGGTRPTAIELVNVDPVTVADATAGEAVGVTTDTTIPMSRLTTSHAPAFCDAHGSNNARLPNPVMDTGKDR